MSTQITFICEGDPVDIIADEQNLPKIGEWVQIKGYLCAVTYEVKHVLHKYVPNPGSTSPHHRIIFLMKEISTP